MQGQQQSPPEGDTVFDAVIVGVGFAGMYMLHGPRGLGFTARVYEAGGGVGGTWYWNRYPGARCDVESMSNDFEGFAIDGADPRNEAPRVRLTERWHVPLDIDVISPGAVAARRVPVV